MILVEQGWYGARSFGPLYDHNREGVGALVPVIDLHELKNVHDEVFNFSRFQLTTQHVAAIVCVLAAQISPLV